MNLTSDSSSMLSELRLPESITTGYEDPVTALFIPLLSTATRFDVAVGYFTSGWLRDTAEGMADFAIRGGVSRWIVSPELHPDDFNSMISEARRGRGKEYAEEKIDEIIQSLKSDTRQELCALIASGVLNFKIALPKEGGGLFHAKIAIAADDHNSSIGCSGSYNFTSAAKSNWEHIDVFKSWVSDESSRVERMKTRFEALWSSVDPSYAVYQPTSALLQKIREYAGDRTHVYEKVRHVSSFAEEAEIELRDYQKSAIQAWGERGGRGTYAMATGSGKTVTALATIKRLKKHVVDENGGILTTVIVVPFKHLLDQWAQEARLFGFDPIRCYENAAVWKSTLMERQGSINAIGSGHIIALVTNATLASEGFQEIMASVVGDFLFVADEAHNLGAASQLKALPQNARFRLALSATPQRYNDDFGTEKLLEYFGQPVIDFSLGDAIQAGFLVPYVYVPSVCELSESEYEEYLELAELIKIEARRSKELGERTREHDRLLAKRADLISGVQSKLTTLESQLKEKREQSEVTHTLVYCGSRRGEDERRHIERTVYIIGTKLDIKVRKFTAAESREERREMLQLFASGELGILAAIKCLDEGVDVPATKAAYILASTSNPREYIQRRGRVLRTYPGKERAYIYDYIVTPPSHSITESDLVARELERAWEFADTALNRAECTPLLDQLAREYRI